MSENRKNMPLEEESAMTNGENEIVGKEPKKRRPKLSDYETVQNWCFHNTKKLMQKYRNTKMCISAALDQLEGTIEDELGVRFTSMVDFAQYMDVDLSGTYLESRMRNMQQNRKMLAFIDRAVNSMRKYDRNGEEYYWILYLKYMAPADDTCINDSDIVGKLNEKNIPISLSTFYRRLNAAIGTLSGILWGYTARDTLHLTKIIQKIEENGE